MTTNHERLDHHCIVDCIVGQALDGMCVGLVLTNAAGRVSWMNRAAIGILGLEGPAARGQLLSQVLRDPQFADFWHQASQEEEAVMGEVTTHFPRHTELKVNASHCVDSQGNVIGRALLFCDVTHERVVQVQLSQEATKRLMEMTESWQERAQPTEGLTPSELKILRLVGEGLGNQEIADAIHVAPSTVRTHLKHVYAKLGLDSRAEAIRYALTHGLV